MNNAYTFKIGSVNDRGTIELTAAGEHLIRALLMKWISEAHRGELAAKEFDKCTPNPFGSNQASYFRSARSFLVARLVSHVTRRIKLGKWIEEISDWQDGQPYPAEWEPLIESRHQLGGIDVVSSPTICQRGTDCGGSNLTAPMDDGHGGEKCPATAPTATPGHNSGEGRVEGGSDADKPGEGGTVPNHRRRGCGKPTGKTDRPTRGGRAGRGKTPPAG